MKLPFVSDKVWRLAADKGFQSEDEDSALQEEILRWLRVEHNIFPIVVPTRYEGKQVYTFDIYVSEESGEEEGEYDIAPIDSYEDAVDVALLKAINLIKV